MRSLSRLRIHFCPLVWVYFLYKDSFSNIQKLVNQNDFRDHLLGTKFHKVFRVFYLFIYLWDEAQCALYLSPEEEFMTNCTDTCLKWEYLCLLTSLSPTLTHSHFLKAFPISVFLSLMIMSFKTLGLSVISARNWFELWVVMVTKLVARAMISLSTRRAIGELVRGSEGIVKFYDSGVDTGR